jgi:hypothetical protein
MGEGQYWERVKDGKGWKSDSMGTGWRVGEGERVKDGIGEWEVNRMQEN